VSPYFVEKVESVLTGFQISQERLEPRFRSVPRAVEVMDFCKRVASPSETTQELDDATNRDSQHEVGAEVIAQPIGASLRHVERAI